MRVRRLAFAASGVVGVSLVGVWGGCRALVGDELTYESGSGGNGGAASTSISTSVSASDSTSASDTSASSTTDVSSTTSTSSGEGGAYDGPPCTTMTLAECGLPPNADVRWQFQAECPNGPWCRYIDTPGSFVQQQGGDMIIQSTPNPTGTGWWSDQTRLFAPLLFRSTTEGDRFVVVTRVSVSGQNYDPPDMTMANTSDYKAGGILLRRSSGPPDYPTEEFYKLEYGYMGTSTFGGEDYGVLAAMNDMGTANHLALDEFTEDVDDVGLAICRVGTDLEFFYDRGDGWLTLVSLGGAGSAWGTGFTMGLFTGTFYNLGEVTTGEFAYYGIRTNEGVGNVGTCLEAIEDFDQALQQGRD